MTRIDPWTITNTRHDASALAQHDSVFAVSNGYLGLRGNLCEDRDGPCPVTLINGVFDELDMFSLIRPSTEPRPWLDPQSFDEAGKSPAVANLPNPLSLRVFIGDREASIPRGAVTRFRQFLSMNEGTYRYTFDYCDAIGRTTRIGMTRFASIVHPHRVFMRYRLTPVDHDAPIRVLSGIDGGVHSNTTGERQFSVIGADVLDQGQDAGAARCVLDARTPARGIDVHVGVVNVCDSRLKRGGACGVVEHDAVHTMYEFETQPGASITLDRFVVLTCSEDGRHGVAADLDAELDAAATQGFEAAREEHRQQWMRLWDRADVQIDGDEGAQRSLRFGLYHLLAAAPRFTDRLSVPVKLLTGEHYQGNTFFDTDLMIVPFYTFTFPEWARTCLDFRHEGLKPGRAIAQELGCEGAKFAWQAGPYGEECLGGWWRFTRANIHIGADVAYCLIQHYQATGDWAYILERGIDLLVEAGRFLAARAVYDEGRDACDLHDVAGPDEAHCESSNNFYTNYLTIQTLRWAADAVDRLDKEDPAVRSAVTKRLGLRVEEPQRWRHVADRLTLLFDAKTKLYEQCDGFYRLPPPPPDLLKDRTAWFVPLAAYQAMNQPDVVMAMVLFRDEFDEAVRRANWEFYREKSMNFSSMSFAINSIMAADMGEMDAAHGDFITAAGMDLDEDLTGRRDTRDGLHGTALGGAWMAAVFGFGGVCLSSRGLRIDPNLPPQWNRLRFNLMLHGERIRVAIDREQVMIDVCDKRSIHIPIKIAGRDVTLRSGESIKAPYR